MPNIKNEILFGLIAVLLLCIIGIGVSALFISPASSVPGPVSVGVGEGTASGSGSSGQSIGGPAGGSDAGSYTMAQVAAHSTPQSCWTAISGSVYDLTAFISQHPGGPQAIESLCGVDGTAAFTAQHGGERRPANELASLYIGKLSAAP